MKNPFASRLAEFDTTLKLLRIAEQLYIVPIKFRFARNRDFLALISLPLAGGPREGKRFYGLFLPLAFIQAQIIVKEYAEMELQQ